MGKKNTNRLEDDQILMNICDALELIIDEAQKFAQSGEDECHICGRSSLPDDNMRVSNVPYDSESESESPDPSRHVHDSSFESESSDTPRENTMDVSGGFESESESSDPARDAYFDPYGIVYGFVPHGFNSHFESESESGSPDPPRAHDSCFESESSDPPRGAYFAPYRGMYGFVPHFESESEELPRHRKRRSKFYSQNSRRKQSEYPKNSRRSRREQSESPECRRSEYQRARRFR